MDEQNRQVQILQVQEEPEESTNIRYYLFLFMRRWWVVAIALAFVIVMIRLYISRIPVLYEATAAVKLPTISPSGGLAASFAFYIPTGMTGDMATEIEVIKGRDLVERVVKKLQYDKKEENANLNQRLLIQKIQNNLNVLRRGQSNLLDIKASAETPEEAKDLANAIANEYIKLSQSSAQNTWDKLINAMGDKLAEAKDDLDKSRQLLHKYEAKEGLTPAFSPILLGSGLSQSSQYGQNNVASDITQSVATLKASVMQIELRLDTLRKRFPDANPDVIDLKNQLAETKQKLMVEENKAIQKYNKIFGLSDFAASVLFNQQLYAELASKHEELKAQYLMQNRSATIIESAIEPLFPKSSRGIIFSLASPIIGLLLGASIILLWEFLDNSIHTPENVKKFLGLTVLGSIPKLRVWKKRDWSPLLIYGSSNSNRKRWVRELYRESYMTFRMEILSSLKFNRDDVTPKSETEKHQGEVILITSSVPKEGKSLVSANFAMSLASTNMKVLLIEIDHRHSSQDRLLKLSAKAGLIDLLLERASLDDVVNHTIISNLYVVTTGTKDDQHELSGLLLSENMSNFIQTAKESYDFIIFDSTPITLGSESTSAGFMVDGVVLVVKLGHTNKDVALKSVQIMRDNGMSILGTVINYAKPDKKYRKYYK